MLFTQYTFLVFLVFVVIGNLLTRGSQRGNHVFLLLASWVFFAYWSLADFCIFLCILLINYPLILSIDRATNEQTRGRLTMASLVLSLGALGAFKYSGFFSSNIAILLKAVGVTWHASQSPLAVPLAISFYTFHIISLALDVKDRKYRAPGLFDYTLYISFFPHIIAGPIVRGDEILPAFTKHPRERPVDYSYGAYLFVLGFFFKTVVGDQLGDVVNPYWTTEKISHLATRDAWCLAILYSGQIFADFAGYSWMAMGLAKLLGFEFPENFRAPYIATTFRTFWRRWHMTLSRFLSDYLYIRALGGSRGGPAATYRNLMLTMLLGGLWHGAAWNFVVWGGLHGGGLALERWANMTEKVERSSSLRISWFLLVQFTVLIAWVFFRAPDLSTAVAFLRQMVHGDAAVANPHLLLALTLLIPVGLYHLYHALPALQAIENTATARGLLTGGLAYAILVMPHIPQGFIYFVF